jgi:hypothetical protein
MLVVSKYKQYRNGLVVCAPTIVMGVLAPTIVMGMSNSQLPPEGGGERQRVNYWSSG